MAEDDGFLSRWSRRKVRAQAGAPLPDRVKAPAAPTVVPLPSSPAATLPTAQPPEVSGLPAAPAPEPAPEPAPTLADVAQLAPGAEVRRFVAPGVDDAVKRAALKKLFADPHFNVMDGLDTYIDDYGRPDPIPLAMLRQMVQARGLGLFDDEGNALPPPGAAPAATTDGAVAATLPESALGSPASGPAADPAPEPHEDADLRLQQDDAAGRPGPGEGPRA